MKTKNEANQVKIKNWDFTTLVPGEAHLHTYVQLIGNNGYGHAFEWLRLRYFDLFRDGHMEGLWTFQVPYQGVTDEEHDQSYVFRIPLVGVEHGFVRLGGHHITAWFASCDPEDFRFPSDGYKNELQKCDAEQCRRGSEKHQIGDYLPPPNPELYEAVRDMKIEINSFVE